MEPALAVREAVLSDYQKIIDYFRNGDDAFLSGMGVERSKLPTREAWLKLLVENHTKQNPQKTFYYVIWEADGEPIGHSNINKIIFEHEAYMHLHMWVTGKRAGGLGQELVRRSIPFFFDQFGLKNLFCEPYALNPAPNKTLPKLGFELVQQYETTPGWISFYQPVNRWLLTKEKFDHLHSSNPKTSD